MNLIVRHQYRGAIVALGLAMALASLPALSFAGEDDLPATAPATLPTSQPTTLPAEAAPTPGKLVLSVWLPSGTLKNPVAMSFDRRGRAYVAETQRREGGEFQVRTDPSTRTLPDHTFVTVEDRARWAGDGDPAWGKQQGGKKETIHLVEDDSGSGKADKTSIFYEGFNKNEADILAGVLWFEGNVYATIAPDLWMLRDKTGAGRADEIKSLSYGYGVHMSYSGHNMHGLCVGPDGKIYFSIGDKALNVTTNDGRKLDYHYCGSILRCNPDGSDLEVFAYGVRNIQEFGFDRYGNLISVDNDGDYPGERERLVYITQDSDSGWRYNWQYRSANFDVLVPRNQRKDHYNPWLAEKLWVPYFPQQAAYITPTLANYTDGPCGVKYATETSLNDKYRGYFFVTEFPKATIRAFAVKPKGASFVMSDDQVVSRGTQVTGLALSPDGALYGCEWGHTGFKLGNVGSIVKLDDPTAANDPARLETRLLLRDGPYKRTIEELTAQLNHADMRVREDAQFELVRRHSYGVLKQVAFDKQKPQMARIHGMWGLGQFVSAKSIDKATATDLAKSLVGTLADTDPEIRTQSVKLLGEVTRVFGALVGDQPVIAMLEDASSRVRFFAAATIAKFKDRAAIPALYKLLGENAPFDPYIRQAGILGLTGIADVDALIAAANHPNPKVRVAAIVALRRLANPGVARFLNDREEIVVTEAARAIHDDFSIPAALPALAKAADRRDITNEAFVRRALNANLRLGGAEQIDRLVRYAADSRNPSPMRVEAINILASWEDPTPFDRVEGWYRVWPKRSGIAVHSAIESQLANLIASDDQRVAQAATALVEKLGLKTDDAVFARWIPDPQRAVASRVAALQLLASRKYEGLAKLIDTALDSREPELRGQAVRILAETDPPRAIELISQTLSQGATREQQSALRTLGTIKTPEAEDRLGEWLNRLASGSVPTELQLDLTEAAESSKSKTLADKLAQYESSLPANDPLSHYLSTLAGGDAERGKAVFNTHAEAACIRCHSTSEGGSTVGPNLAGIGAKPDKPRRYLLESMIVPSAFIVPGYGTEGVTLKNGQQLSGMVKSEDANTLQLVDLDGTSATVKKSDIATRTPPTSAMPVMAGVLTKAEIRDVIEYLSSLKN
ncbi:MAG TPA: HEAT repeat domain-containing protein [Humisphaera sp.]|nr:HEAT repeat domain-containing protein [Humisphaera sp.]